jgi:hypothetical protein
MRHMIQSLSGNTATMLDSDPSAKVVITDFDLELAAVKVLEANRILREHLLSYDCVIQDSLEMHRTGMRIRDVMRALPPADATIGSEVEVVGVFEARLELRRMLVVALLADGMPMAEVASTLKIPIATVSGIASEVGVTREEDMDLTGERV